MNDGQVGIVRCKANQMSKKKGGGGFLFNIFNVGFTIFMFILPTIGLGLSLIHI